MVLSKRSLCPLVPYVAGVEIAEKGHFWMETKWSIEKHYER